MTVLASFQRCGPNATRQGARNGPRKDGRNPSVLGQPGQEAAARSVHPFETPAFKLEMLLASGRRHDRAGIVLAQPSTAAVHRETSIGRSSWRQRCHRSRGTLRRPVYLEAMADAQRDVERGYSASEVVARLRRLADALEVGKPRHPGCRSTDSGVFHPVEDAWVVGEEPAVFVEFQGAATYAKS